MNQLIYIHNFVMGVWGYSLQLYGGPYIIKKEYK